jgi:alkyl hydroperoxide reductase subunit AhpC
MPDSSFKEIKLSDYKGKYVVLFFYPLDFTFVCPTEICAFNDSAKGFHDSKCELIACSVDSHFTHAEYTMKPRKTGGLGPL